MKSNCGLIIKLVMMLFLGIVANVSMAQSKATLQLTVYQEGFEGFDRSNPLWLPEGWSLQKSADLLTATQSWHVTTGDPLLNMRPDGSYCIGMEGNQPARNETLKSCPLDLSHTSTLSFRLYYDPAYLFCMDAEHVDFSRYEFINQEKAVTLEVWLQPQNGSSSKLFDLTEQYAGYTLQELLADMPPQDMREFRIELPALEQPANLLFKYVGTKGTYLYLDDIRLVAPIGESCYSFPRGMMYWGTDCTSGWHTLAFDGKTIGMLSVNKPLTYVAEPIGPDVMYSWTFTDNVCGTEITEEGCTYTAEYHPHHQTPTLQRNNWYAPVIMQPQGGDMAYSPYDGGIAYLQVGGRAEYEVAGKLRRYGLLHFDPLRDGLEVSEDISNRQTDAILNVIETPDAPLVVDGLWLNARGEITVGAHFQAYIYGVDEDGSVSAQLAQAKCDYPEVQYAPSNGSYGYAAIPFVFDAPVVLDKADFSSYAIRVDGMSSNSALLMPAFSGDNASQHSGVGYITDEIGNHISIGERLFAINLDAYYPWLTCDTDEVGFEADEEEIVVDFDSYHYGADLHVTQADGSPLPEWLTVWGEGRYNSTRLHFQTQDPGSSQYMQLLVTAAGVSYPITLNKQTGIYPNNPNNPNHPHYYTLQGVEINNPAAPGLYIVVGRDGVRRKVCLR